jgi:hypothetical protein
MVDFVYRHSKHPHLFTTMAISISMSAKTRQGELGFDYDRWSLNYLN